MPDEEVNIMKENEMIGKAAKQQVSSKAEDVNSEKTKSETVKAAAVKAEAVKKEEPKAEKVQAADEAVKPAVKRGRPKKDSTDNKTTAKKSTAAKKTADKKTAGRPKKSSEYKKELFVQFNGNQIDEAEIIKRVEADLKEQNVSISDLKLYLKPEDNACYYVANGKVAGKVDLY